MYFFELSKSQIVSIKKTKAFDINGSILYDEKANEFYIKRFTEKGYQSKKSLMTWFTFDYEDGYAILSDEIAKILISNHTGVVKTFETADQRFQREKAYGMISLAKRITDEIR